MGVPNVGLTSISISARSRSLCLNLPLPLLGWGMHCQLQLQHVQATDIKKALKRQGHSAKTPWNHFENFDRGFDSAVTLTATMIARECSAEWNEFNVRTRTPLPLSP